MMPPDEELSHPGRASRPAPRAAVAALEGVVHGAPDYAELEALGLEAGDVLDFSVNGNPYGPSPTVRAAIARVPLDRYPDRECLALRRALAARLGLELSQLVVGNGAAELLWLCAAAYLSPGDQALIVGPTFGEYRRVANLCGAAVTTWLARREDAFAVDPGQVAREIGALDPRIVFLCNPNNPTGTALDERVIAGWADTFSATLFLVDEAYLGFTDLPGVLRHERANVLALRSMTKDYALAGLRLGYMAGPARLVAPVARVRPPWSVNALAQAAGLAALADEPHLRRTMDALRQAKEGLMIGLRGLGLAPLPSVTPFFLVEVGDAAAFRRTLLRRRILVRDASSFGLPGHVRIATRRPEENDRLLAAIRQVLGR